MLRFSPNFAAAFAAIIITLVSVQAVTVVPHASASVATLPAIA
ncbi:hypothetical protein [Qipengyuania sphaerica]|nr:hypothetical protein [Qipengyuania sphaerica]